MTNGEQCGRYTYYSNKTGEIVRRLSQLSMGFLGDFM